MKKIIYAVVGLIVGLLVFGVSVSMAQDVTAKTDFVYSDSLKTTHDSVSVQFQSPNAIGYYTVTAWTDSGTDTVQVYTQVRGGTVWVQHGLVDMAGNGNVTQMVVTTTPKEWAILDSSPQKVMLYSAGTTAIITRFTVAGK
jgi:hypothetical protein